MNSDFPELRRLLAIGTGVGIEIEDDVLRVAAVGVRPAGARLLGAATINGFRERTAGGWGAVCADFLKRTGAEHLAATVLLPRRDVVVRLLALAGVKDQDIQAAIDFQIDSLHPYPEKQATYAWACLGGGAVLVAITRKDTLERYFGMFSEAGVKVAAFIFSAAVLYSATRLLGRPPARGVLAFSAGPDGLEAYGESEARPVLSAAFDVPRERAAELACAELRLDAEVEPVDIAALLPIPSGAPPDYDSSRNALAYAAALAGACPRLALPLNLLPVENRSSNSRDLRAHGGPAGRGADIGGGAGLDFPGRGSRVSAWAGGRDGAVAAACPQGGRDRSRHRSDAGQDQTARRFPAPLQSSAGRPGGSEQADRAACLSDHPGYGGRFHHGGG